MISDSYQSSVLRFVVGHYRRGVNRHRDAVSRANTRVKVSAEVGTALIGLPIYMTARAAVIAGRKLRQALDKKQLPTLSAQARKVLNFSGFEDLEDAVTDPDTTDTLAVDVVNSQLKQRSARPIFQTLVAVGNCLSLRQLELISDPEALPASDLPNAEPGGRLTVGERLKGLVGRWRASASRLLSFETVVSGGLRTGESELAVARKVTGVASDLKSRSLVLVLDYQMAWKGLSVLQQSRLRRKMSMFLGDRSNVFLPRTLQVGLSALVSRLGLQFKLASVAHTPAELTAVKSSNIVVSSQPTLDRFAIQLSKVGSLVTQSVTGEPLTVTGFSAPMAVSASVPSKLFSSDRNDSKRKTIEADVISTTYVEHPLEKLLKWVDRVLLWVEKQWRWIKQLVARKRGLTSDQ